VVVEWWEVKGKKYFTVHVLECSRKKIIHTSRKYFAIGNMFYKVFHSGECSTTLEKYANDLASKKLHERS